MKNKKGFTLVELIVAIAIVISILLIAIVSVTKISTKQKENAYEQVKQEVIGAAEDYALVNEYLFETLGVGGSKTIPLKDLVEQDYLNVLTNPITGKKLEDCNYVKITKKETSYNYEFIDNDKKCVGQTLLVVEGREPGDPDMELVYDDPNEHGWYNEDINIGITPLEKNNGTIKYVYVCSNENCTNPIELTEFYYDEDNRKVYKNKLTNESVDKDTPNKIWYKVTNIHDKYVIQSFEYYLDRTEPILKYGAPNSTDFNTPGTPLNASTDVSNTNWTNNKAEFSIMAKDNLSGIDINGANNNLFYIEWNTHGNYKDYGTLNKNGTVAWDRDNKNLIEENGVYIRSDGSLESDGKRHERYEVCDKAGNCVTSDIYANIDTTTPECSIIDTAKYPDRKENSWYNQYTGQPSVTLKVTDNNKTIKDETKNVNASETGVSFNVDYTDAAGNSCTENKTIYYDNTAPTITYNESTPKKLNANQTGCSYNGTNFKGIYVNVTINDTYSGLYDIEHFLYYNDENMPKTSDYSDMKNSYKNFGGMKALRNGVEVMRNDLNRFGNEQIKLTKNSNNIITSANMKRIWAYTDYTRYSRNLDDNIGCGGSNTNNINPNKQYSNYIAVKDKAGNMTISKSSNKAATIN